MAIAPFGPLHFRAAEGSKLTAVALTELDGTTPVATYDAAGDAAPITVSSSLGYVAFWAEPGTYELRFTRSDEEDVVVETITVTSADTLDTIAELASALGNDPAFATTVAAELAGKATPADVANALTTVAAEYGRLDVSGRLKVGQLATVASRAPLAPATDAHATRVTNDLTRWHTWLAGKAGAVTEFGFPCRGKGAAEWGALAEAWFQTLDGFTDSIWATQWGAEFGDADVPFDEVYPGTVFTANKYNRMAVYSHVPAGGTLLGPMGRLTLGSSVLEHHFSSKQTNRYGVVVNSGVNGYIGTTMSTDALTPGRSCPYNSGPTHDMSAGIGAGLTCQTSEYSYGTFTAPAGTMTTPEFLAARGVGVVRVPIRWERVQPVLGAALDATELTRLDAAVAAYNAAGVQVILDIHNWGYYFIDDNEGTTAKTLGSVNVTQAHFVDLWTRMATHFVGMAGVVGYELMNEPAGVASAASWQTISQAAFNAIIAIDTATTVLVGTGGGNDFSGLRTVTTSHPGGPWITGDTNNQARYVSHHYWDYVTTSAPSTYAATYQQNVTAAETAGFVQSRSGDGNWYFPTVRTGAGMNPMRRATNYWHNPPGVPNATALAVSGGVLYLVPFLSERPITVDAVTWSWVAHPTGGHVRAGIWAETGNQGRPGGTPLVDSGHVVSSLANGQQTIVFGSPLSTTLRAKYWIGLLIENDTTGSPTVSPYTPSFESAQPQAVFGQNCSFINGLTTTLPNIAADPSGLSSLQWPLIAYRVSAFT